MASHTTARPTRFLRWAVLSILVVGALGWCFTRGPGRYGIYYAVLRVPHNGTRVWAVQGLAKIPDRWSTRLLLLYAPPVTDRAYEINDTTVIVAALWAEPRLKVDGVETELLLASGSPHRLTRWRAFHCIGTALVDDGVLLGRIVDDAQFLETAEQWIASYDGYGHIKLGCLEKAIERNNAHDQRPLQIVNQARRGPHTVHSILAYDMLIRRGPQAESAAFMQQMLRHPDTEVFAAGLSIAADLMHTVPWAVPKAPADRLNKLSSDPMFVSYVLNYRHVLKEQELKEAR